MMKLLIISNNHSYVNELKRSALLSDMDILSICYGVEDVRKRINSNIEPDVIIASDILFPGSTVESIVNIIREAGMLDKLYFVLRNTSHSDYLMNHNIQYVFENDVAPLDLLNMLKNPAVKSGESMDELDARIVEDTETKQMANILAQEKVNRRRLEENYVTETVLSENKLSGNNFKSIMVAVNSPKGGVGKTAIAMELAFLLAARAKEVDFNPASKLAYSKKVSVCLVDLNPSFDTMASTLECVRSVHNYPTLSDWVQKIEEKIFNSLTKEEKEALLKDENHDFAPFINESAIRFTHEEVLKLLVHDPQTDLYLLPSISLPFDVEYVKEQYIRIILTNIRALFDVTIVDTGNNISFFTVQALQQANEIFLITNPTAGSSVVLGKLIKNLDRLQLEKSKFNLVVNSPNGKEAELDADTISKVLKLPLVSELPFDEGVKMAHEKGMPYCIYNKKTPFAREAVKLAQQICPLWTAVQKRKPITSSRGKFFRFGKK